MNDLPGLQVKAYHREYLEKGTVSRDVVIVAHGHFNRVLIARWIKFPLSLGRFLSAETGYTVTTDTDDSLAGTHFNVEPAGVSMFIALAVQI